MGVSMLPGGGIAIGVCGRVPCPIPGEGIGIGTCPDEGLGAKPTPAGIVWPCGGIADAWGVRGVLRPGPTKGVEPAGAGLGIGIMPWGVMPWGIMPRGIMPWGITGGPCGPMSGLGMRICGLCGKIGGARGVIEGPAACGGGAGCGSGMDIPCGANGCVRTLAAAGSDGMENWSRCRRRRCLRGRTLLYVVGWGWDCDSGT
jgi:hypothetical protein